MSMKKLILLIAATFAFHTVWSQEQSAVFTHYTVNPILVSPAVAGFNENHAIHMNFRSQWTGFPESPKSYGIGYNGPIGKTLGIGLGVMSENLGNLTNTRVQLNYAFRYQVKNVKFAAGFSTEFITKRIANSVLNSPLYEQDDELIENAVDGNKVFDASLGAFATFKKNTFIGITFPNLVVAKIGEIETGKNEGSFFKYSIIHFGHEFEVEPYNFKLKPSLLVYNIKDKPLQIDFNMLGSFINDRLIAGVSVRAGTGGATGLLLGTNIDVFKLYYSYDLTFQKIQQYNNGSHELTLLFSFERGKKRYDRSPSN
jgi:type IX secretion system PorP/SprF family membrane protein